MARFGGGCVVQIVLVGLCARVEQPLSRVYSPVPSRGLLSMARFGDVGMVQMVVVGLCARVEKEEEEVYTKEGEMDDWRAILADGRGWEAE